MINPSLGSPDMYSHRSSYTIHRCNCWSIPSY